MGRIEAERKPEKRARDSMPPERDTLDSFKPPPEKCFFPRKKIYRAKKEMKKGNLVSARDILESAIEEHPDNEYVISLFIKLSFKTGDIDYAEKLFEEHRETNNPFFYNSMISGYGKAWKIKKAEELFEEAVKKGIAGSYTYNSMIDIYSEKLLLGKVRNLFSEAVRLEVATAYTYNRMIYACARIVEMNPENEKVVGEARKIFDIAVKKGIATGYTYSAILSVYSNAAKADEAMEILKMAIGADMAHPGTYKKTIYAFGNAGDIQGAKEVYIMSAENGKGTEEVRNALLSLTYKKNKEASGGD